MELKNNKILISAIVVVLVVLVSYNFESLTGQPVATSNSRIITVTPKTGTMTFTVTPRSGTMNLGGSYKEQLWLDGPSGVARSSNYKCVDWPSGKGTGSCTQAEGNIYVPPSSPGTYTITIEKTTSTGREILATKIITV